MADLDCGDCDCNGADCDCDCDCGCDCACDCFDDCCCCTGDTNIFLCCCFFPAPPDDNARRANRRASTTSDCSICCCCCRSPRRSHSTTPKKKRRKGICSRLWSSCFRGSKEPSPPSSPPRAQPRTENVPPGPMGRRDGRYPMDDSQLDYPPFGYLENNRNQARREELRMSPRDNKMDGKWSRPAQYGDYYDRHFKS